MKAYHPITYDLSIIIDDIEYGINDRVVWRFSCESKLHKSRVYYGVNDSYIIIHKRRYSLDDFMRVNGND